MISIISPVQSVARHLLSLFATEEFMRSAYMATVNSGPGVEPLKLADSRWVVVDRRSVVGSGCERLSPGSGKRVLVRQTETVGEQARHSTEKHGQHDKLLHTQNRNAEIRARVFLDKVKRG